MTQSKTAESLVSALVILLIALLLLLARATAGGCSSVPQPPHGTNAADARAYAPRAGLQRAIGR